MSGGRRAVYPLYGVVTGEREAQRTRQEHDNRWPAESLSLGSVSDNLTCYLPSSSDWHFLQPSEVTEQKGVWEPWEHLPWPSLVLVEDFFEPGDDSSEADRALANGAAADAVRAFRLLKDGWFLDPVLSESIFDNGAGRLDRRMAAYRLTYHDEDAESYRPKGDECYRLAAEDFTDPASPDWRGFDGGAKGGAGTRVGATFELLQRHRRQPVESAEIALHAYSRSFGLLMPLAQQLMLLMLAFEAMLGRPRAGAQGGERLGFALALAGAGSGDDGVKWFEDELVPLRNDAAHGRGIAPGGKGTLQRFRSLMRALLFHYVVFSQRFAAMGGEGGDRSGRPADFTEAFGKCIVEARGPELAGEPGDLVRLP
jgi:hypothetical protein